MKCPFLFSAEVNIFIFTEGHFFTQLHIMPPKEKAPSAKDKRKAAKQAELAVKESMEACLEGEAILDKINVDKNIGTSLFPKAVVPFSRAIALDDNNAQAYLLRARCMKGMQEFDNAIADYTKALEVNPSDYEALSCRTYCYEQVRDWDAAIEDCTAVIAIQPDDDHAYNMRGYARAAKRPPGLKLKGVEYKQVVADFTKAIELNECNYYAYANRANVRFDRCEYYKAIEDYSRALFIKDDYWFVHSRRGLAYYEYVLNERTPKEVDGASQGSDTEEVEEKGKQEQWEEEFWAEEQNQRRQEQQEAFLVQAIKDFSLYLKHFEKDTGDQDTATLLHRAHTYLLQGNLDESLKDFKKAKELEPSLQSVVNPKIDAIREQTGVKALVSS